MGIIEVINHMAKEETLENHKIKIVTNLILKGKFDDKEISEIAEVSASFVRK